MKQGELIALTWDSINWITKKIPINKNYIHDCLLIDSIITEPQPVEKLKITEFRQFGT